MLIRCKVCAEPLNLPINWSYTRQVYAMPFLPGLSPVQGKAGRWGESTRCRQDWRLHQRFPDRMAQKYGVPFQGARSRTVAIARRKPQRRTKRLAKGVSFAKTRG